MTAAINIIETPGPRLIDGSDINTIIAAVNALAAGTGAGTYTGTFNGIIGGITPAVGTFTTVNATTLNAGADASAGTVVSFPSTTASGKLILAAVNSAGAFNTTISNASMGQASVVSIPDPGASTANFLLNKGAQSVAGATTFTGGLVVTTTNATITDVNVVLGTATGTKFGTATSQKLAFYNSTPVVQQATTGTSTGFTAGGGTTATSTSTFTGNSGSAAYTVGDIVLALKNLGLMAA